MDYKDIKQALVDHLMKYRPSDREERSKFNLDMENACRAVWKAHKGSQKPAKGGKPDVAEALKKYLESPMSDEERNKYALAAMDMALANGADIKELTEIRKTWGIGQAAEQKIEVCDFSTCLEYWESRK